jgi:hypothetical protein
MGTLLRAAFAFLIAFSIQNPERAAACFETLGLQTVKAQLKADHPRANLERTVAVWLAKHTDATSD